MGRKEKECITKGCMAILGGNEYVVCGNDFTSLLTSYLIKLYLLNV